MPSKKAINRAGQLLREWWGDPAAEADDVLELTEAVRRVAEWRTSHQHPLVLVNNGVRAFVRAEGGTILVSQRLKRVPTIVDKLHRHRNMQVTQMQDIAGCRAILHDQNMVNAVLARIVRNWAIRGEIDDYVTRPPATRYRAIHVVVTREERMIEIQLRTRRQHAWAAAVERASGLDVSLHRIKDGIGPDEVVAYFRAASDVLAVQEAGLRIDNEAIRHFIELREAARALHPGVLLGA